MLSPFGVFGLHLASKNRDMDEFLRLVPHNLKGNDKLLYYLKRMLKRSFAPANSLGRLASAPLRKTRPTMIPTETPGLVFQKESDVFDEICQQNFIDNIQGMINEDMS
jgi:hypothetical protein